MQVRKIIIACLLVVCLLLPIAGCAEQENAVHPAGFDTYAPLLGWHKDPILDQLELKADDLTKKMVWVYGLPDSVEYCGIPFEVCLEIESEYRLLNGFMYRITFPQADEAAAEKIIGVAKHLTEALGIPYSATHLEPDTQFLSEMTPAELAKLLSKDNRSVYDRWSLGILDTPEIAALSAWADGFGAGKSSKLHRDYPPTLLLELGVYSYEDGTVFFELRYSLDYNSTWEQVTP